MSGNFFINRPILSIVLSLLIMICGAVSIFNLPVEQYPNLTPPTIFVKAQYPGASASVISESVASVLEEKINGVENMIYMNSVISASTGDADISVSFAIGTDPDKAMINVNNRVQEALTKLPDVVRQYGVSVHKRSTAILQVGTLYSTSPLYDANYLGNYALLNLVDNIKRVKGVGDVFVLSGNDYAIRVWPKLDMLAKADISMDEVVAAIQSHNKQRAAGKIGQQPVAHVDKSYTIVAHGRYTDVEQFKNIVLRANSSGDILKLQDVADVELGAQSYEIDAKNKGNPCAPILFFLSPGANALDTVALVEEKIAELSEKFPNGVHFQTIFDTTKSVKASIIEVIKTLFEAVFLVILVILLFLKKFRATIIPCLAVPVSIIGTFAGMMMLGFSINTLTLFGLVLAIGIVVDDAIIVIENVERIMATEHLGVKEATAKAIKEVTGPVIAIVLVLCSVFVPVAFVGGMSGIMYRQFAITIAISVIISGIVALTLTPALCIMMLDTKHIETTNKFMLKFDQMYEAFSSWYLNIVEYFTRHVKTTLTVLAALILCIVFLFRITPTSLLPDEDQGVCMACGIMDPGASLSKAKKVANFMEHIAMNDPAVENLSVIAGYDLLSSSAKNNGVTMFMKLKPYEDRKTPELSSFATVKRIMMQGARATDAIVMAFNPPPIVGMSTTGGFECYLQAISDADVVKLNDILQKVLVEAKSRPELTGVRSSLTINSPQYKMDVDELKALSMGVSLDSLYLAVQCGFSSVYINDFSKAGKSFKVFVQAKGNYRAYPEQINEMYVKSKSGEMIPLSAFVTLTPTIGCDMLDRFNNRLATKIIGNPAAGYTSGDALKAMEEVFNKVLDDNYGFSWSGSAYQERSEGGTGSVAMLLGIMVVFLILAAQYERWSLPLAVILSVPFAMLGALIAVLLRGYSNDLYFQVAILTLIGLSAKNAILIVEYAVILRKEGMSLVEAAIKAARMRLRPIIMTSLAFIFGCLPLAISSGAGAASRHSLGTGVVGGMISSTFLAPLFIPMFFVIVSRISEKLRAKKS